MALAAIRPFSQSKFSEEVAEFGDWAVQRVADAEIAGRIGWLSHLTAYDWQGADWRAGLEQRRELSGALAAAGTEQELRAAIDQVVAWGRMQTLSQADARGIAESLPLLDALRAGGTAWDGVHGRRIATASKVYAIHDLETWAIYDSRVGSALARLVAAWWGQIGNQRHEGLLRFGLPPRRGGPQSDLPAGFRPLTTDRQARLSFIYASWLLQLIATRLSDSAAPPEGSGWHVAHVEMALFVLGASSTEWPVREQDPPPLGADRLSTSSKEERMVNPGMAAAAAVAAVKTQEVLQEQGLDSLKEQMDDVRSRSTAIQYAEETGGRAQKLAFGDGARRWVVFKGDKPIESFPEYSGDLEEGLAFHDRDRLRPEDPDTLRDSGKLNRLRAGIERRVDGFREERRRSATEDLIEQLEQDEEPMMRAVAAVQLGATGDSGAVGALIGALHDPNKTVRAAAAHSLGVVGERRADGPLKRLLDDRSPEVRAEAACSLGAVRGDDSFDPLVVLVNHESEKPEVRAAAAIGLAALGDSRALDPLVTALESRSKARSRSEREVPAQAALAIGLLGDQRGLPALVHALDDDAPTIRVAVVTALGFLGSRDAIDPLDAALNDPDRDVVKAAFAAIDTIEAVGAGGPAPSPEEHDSPAS